MTECYKHSFKKIFYLNYNNDKNIDVKTERKKFEDIVENSLLKDFGWYLAPKYIEYKTNAKWLQYDDVVEFKLKRKTVELSFDQLF